MNQKISKQIKIYIIYNKQLIQLDNNILQIVYKKQRKVISEKIALKKAELTDKIKNGDYSELEGARVFAKCFLSAIHSIEERIDDQETRYAVVKLLSLLHGNFRNFLDSTNKTIQKLKKQIEVDNLQIKAFHANIEAEHRSFEEMIKKEKIKYEMKPLVQQFNMIKEKHYQLKISSESEKKEMMGEISLLNIKNKKLAEELKKIEEDADVRKNTDTIQSLRKELHDTQELLKNEKEEKSNTGYKLHTLLEATKSEVKERDLKINEKILEYNDLLRNYNITSRELKENRSLMKENKERMAMTTEDIMQMQLKLNRKDSLIMEKKATIEELNKKVDELETQLRLQREGLVQKKEISMEGTLFDIVWDYPLSKINNSNKYSSRKSRDEFEKRRGMIVEKMPETGEVRLDTVDPGRYNFERPSYAAMISDFFPKEEGEGVSYSAPFPVWLNVTIRAIFDSKYNEILLSYNKGKRISRFPDFVYSWLGTFYVDKETKGIKQLDYMNKEEVARKGRCDILYGLEAFSAAKLWEITVFKDFLTETLSLDELVFFLHCRFLLFKGPQMAIPTAGYCVTHFVTKERVVDTIDRVMYKYSLDERKDLRSKLLDFAKSTYKDSNAFDYAMVLRILLEFYRKEKKENFARFEELYLNTKKADII